MGLSFKHGSLFSGIGGFDLAAEWMGWENVFHCEWNEFSKRILNYYWPNAESFDDITKTDFTKYANTIDILTGGFPCQPYSVAGKRKGKEDERHLWPEMLRAIREIQPSYVVGENVAGLISWNGGLVFHEVQTDLENEGYEVWPFILPACAVNAPHRRDRIWFVAYSEHNTKRQNGNSNKAQGRGNTTIQTQDEGRESSPIFDSGLCDLQGITTNSDSNGHELRGFRKDRSEESQSISKQEKREWIWTNVGRTTKQTDAADTSIERLQRGENIGKFRESGEKRNEQPSRFFQSTWDEFPTQSPICSRNDGISEQLDGITFPKWRSESVKAYGNAIVPQVVLQIFKAIQIADRQMSEGKKNKNSE